MRLIDADTLKKDLEVISTHNLYKTDYYNRIRKAAIVTALNFVNDAPTVDPVKHGHWIDRTTVDSEIVKPWQGRYRCSICGIALDQNWYFRYCPLCGSKMDEEEF